MKNLRKLFAAALCFSIIFGTMSMVSAVDTSSNNSGYDKSILLKMGMSEDIINILPEEDAQELISAYLANPNSVDIASSTLEVDVLKEMNEFINKTDLELATMGYTQDQIEKGRLI